MRKVIKITKIIAEILDVFNEHDFKPLDLQKIGDKLGIKPNTINQRIIRYEAEDGGIFITKGKPKMISVKREIPEVVFYRDDYHCLLCKNGFSLWPDQLTMQKKNPKARDKTHYNNQISVCKNCLEHPPYKIETISYDSIKKDEYHGDLWEYITVRIYKEYHYEPFNLHSDFSYFIFHEVKDENQTEKEIEWYNLSDEKEGISSRSIDDVLNVYGKQGWELIYCITVKTSEYDEVPSYIEALFKRKIMDKEK